MAAEIGDYVERDEEIATIETDKVSAETRRWPLPATTDMPL